MDGACLSVGERPGKNLGALKRQEDLFPSCLVKKDEVVVFRISVPSYF